MTRNICSWSFTRRIELQIPDYENGDNKVPAGSALAVDRDDFAKDVNKTINSISNINIINQEVKNLNEFDDQIIIISTGPLTSRKLADSIKIKTSENSLAFMMPLPLLFIKKQ